MTTVFYFFSWLGDWERVVLIGVLILAVLFCSQRYRDAWLLLSVVAVSKAISVFGKELFARARPDRSLWLTDASGFSFPSGHATVAMALYGGLGYLVWKHVKNPGARYPVLTLCLILVMGIGFSRVYLGVHWLTDVIGGWIIGGIVLWALLIRREKERSNL